MSGISPINDPLILTWNADYLHRYYKHPSDNPIPVGTTAEIVIVDSQDDDPEIVATWPATTVTPDYVEFWVQVAQTNLIESGLFYRLYLHYPPSGSEQIDHCWYRGTIKREQ